MLRIILASTLLVLSSAVKLGGVQTDHKNGELALADAAQLRFIPRSGQCDCPTHFSSIWQQCSCRMDALFEWMASHGALFPNLEYRDGGMFATADLPENALLAYVPTTLVLTHTGGSNKTTIPGLAAKLHEAAMNPDHFFRPFVESLPWACQTPQCGATPWPALNLTQTELFKEVLQSAGMNSSAVDAVEQSLALSRRWDFGLIPGMDLFNHDNAANPIAVTPNSRAILL